MNTEIVVVLEACWCAHWSETLSVHRYLSANLSAGSRSIWNDSCQMYLSLAKTPPIFRIDGQFSNLPECTCFPPPMGFFVLMFAQHYIDLNFINYSNSTMSNCDVIQIKIPVNTYECIPFSLLAFYHILWPFSHTMIYRLITLGRNLCLAGL